MLLMARVPLPVLVSVTACAVLGTPIVSDPKLRLGTDQVATGAVPVPVNVTTWGLPGALSTICIVADLAPTACGVNVAQILQEAPAPKVLPHLFDSGAKSRRSTPATDVLLKFSVAVPVLVTVTA